MYKNEMISAKPMTKKYNNLKKCYLLNVIHKVISNSLKLFLLVR